MNERNEFNISVMEVEYPDREEVAAQKRLIIEKSMADSQPFLRRVYNIYLGPGFSVIFYQCRGVWLAGVLIYLAMVYAGMSFLRSGGNYFFALLIFPLLYLAFSAISHLGEEQSRLVELKQSMKYSFSYLVSLRMLWTSIFSVAVNIVVCMIVLAGSGELWSVCAAGVSSTFLLSMLSVYLCYKGGRGWQILLIAGGWTVVCGILAKSGGFWSDLLFHVVPEAVHIAVAAGCFVAYCNLIRKVERKNAYA